MQLLYRRPLACICVCFLCALYGAQYLASSAKLVVMAILCPLILIALLWIAFSKQHRLVLLTLFLCLISLFLGVFHIYAWIDRPYEEALARTGSRTVELQVISHEYSTEYSSEYLVELTKIGEDRVSIRSYMVCGFVSDLQAGDEIYARVELKAPDQMTHGIVPAEKCRDSRVLLTTVLYDAEDGVGLHRGAEDSFFNRLFKRNGIEMLSADLRQTVSAFFDRALGKEISPMARGFFMGDTSKMSAEHIRDFRRSGLSHLLAVSGLHISALLGAVELLLRKLTVTKKIRMVTIAVLAVLLLMLTGFSMSACRAVWMLFFVYLHFMLAEDPDSVTSLLVSVSIILLFSPHSIADLGLWMSFFATLGLVVVYPEMESRLPKKIFHNRILHRLWRLVRAVCLLVVMTLVCNLFLLPIMWSVFREISLVTLFANLTVGPLGTLFLYQIPIVLLVSGIPIIGEAAVEILTMTGNGMTTLSAFFSSMEWAVQSLRYRFADVIIPLLTLTMIVLLLIRLRHKWLMLLPPIVAATAFVICLSVTYAQESPQVAYIRNGQDRLLSVTDNGNAILCDLSCDDVNAYFDAIQVVEAEASTYVDAVILGHASVEHPEMLARLFAYTPVGSLWLPNTDDAREARLLREIAQVAVDAHVAVYEYEWGSTWTVMEEVTVCLEKGEQKNTVAACFLRSSAENVCYVDFSVAETTRAKELKDSVLQSHTVLLSAAGERYEAFDLTRGEVEKIFFDEPPEKMPMQFRCGDIPCYIYRDTKHNRIFLLTEK